VSNRYYALYANAGWVLFDNCVDKGSPSKRIGIADTQGDAVKLCDALNKEDALAKAAYDKVDWAQQVGRAHRVGDVHVHGVDMAASGTKDATAVFTMDVETQAKRFYIGPVGLHVSGSYQAIDALRAKLNARYMRVQELSAVNARLRENLRASERHWQAQHGCATALQNQVDALTLTIESLRQERDKLADAYGQSHNHESEACRKALAEAHDDARMVRIQRDSLERQAASAQAAYTELRNSVVGLASNL
jgi:hypothetical protein